MGRHIRRMGAAGEDHADRRTQRRRVPLQRRVGRAASQHAAARAVQSADNPMADAAATPHPRGLTVDGHMEHTDMSLATHAPRKRGDTRTRMLISAAEVMRERGAAGVTIDAVLARSGAPRGSVYYHFPDGRNQILSEALRYSGDSITATIDAAADHGARVLLREFIELWERLLADGDFNAGCPVVAAAISSDETDQDLTVEAGMILGRWCTALTQAFSKDGFGDD